VIDQNWWNPTTQTSTDRFQYGYDRDGDVLYSNNLVNSAQSELYRANSTQSGDSNTAYDPLNRQVAFARGTLSSSGHNGSQLDTIASSSRSQSWSLDALGNWSSVTTNGSATTRTFNAQDQTATVSGGTAPTYDNNGNTTGDSGLTYVYDAWNRLVAAKSGSTTVAAYAYDALGRRITETYSGTNTTNHLYYSPQWQVIEERQNGTGTSNVSYQYVWGAANVDELVLRDTYSGGVKTQRLYAQQNANYDVTALINTSGQVQERYLYDPYGAVTITDANWNPRTGNTSNFGWQYLHQGGRLDSVTGWYGFRNRDLIPSEGRWAERDPLGFGGGDVNLYRFVGNEPVVAADPLGESWTDWINPVAIGSSLGTRIGNGYASLFVKDYALEAAVYEAQRRQLDVQLADPRSSLDASATFMPDRRQIDGNEIKGNINDAANVIDGAVASAELGIEVAGVIDAGRGLRGLARRALKKGITPEPSCPTPTEPGSRTLEGLQKAEAEQIAAAERLAQKEASRVAMAKKVPKPGARGKAGATDIPSWVGDTPNVGESGNEFAGRMMDENYGEGKWSGTGPTSEFNKIKKWADRHFMDPQ